MSRTYIMGGDKGNGNSFLEDENEAALPQWTFDMNDPLYRLRLWAECQDSFVWRLSTSLLSSMARSIFRKWESTRNSADTERVPDFLVLVKEELCEFAEGDEIAEEYKRRNCRGPLKHEQSRRQRTEYHPRRKSSLSQSMDDSTLNLENLQPERFGPDSPSPISPQRGLADPKESRSYERNENRSHRRRRSKRPFRKAEEKERREAEKEERREAEKEERRQLRRSVEPSMSPEKADPVGELEESGEFKRSDLQEKELDTSLLKNELVVEHSSGEAKVSDDPEGKSLIFINTKEAADTASTLQSSVEHTSTTDTEIKSLGSSITSSISDSTSDLQGSEASLTSEISKTGTSQHSYLPSTESGTSISSDFDMVGVAQKPELPSTEAEKNIAPEESSTLSDDFLTSVEDNPLIGGAQETFARAKVSQEDEERRMKRTIKDIQRNQKKRLTCQESTTTDVLLILIQLTESRDLLGGWINGSGNRRSDESTLTLFIEGLECAREIAEKNQINLQHLK